MTTVNANDLAGRAQPGPPRRAGRWPGGGRDMPDLAGQLTGLQKAIGDLSGVLEQMSPRVIDSRIVALDANGQASGQHRLPFASLAVTSFSGSQLTIAAAPPAGSAPGPGPGVTQVAPRGFRVLNARAYAWSVYGGSPGDLVDIQAFSRPQPPAAAPAGASAPVASLFAFGTQTGPLAGTNIASMVAPAPGLYAMTLLNEVSGTVTAAEQDNLRLAVNAVTVISGLPLPAGAAAGGQAQPISANVRVPAGNVSVQAKGNAGVAAVYTSLIIATLIAP